jgi:hypothetical protein
VGSKEEPGDRGEAAAWWPVRRGGRGMQGPNDDNTSFFSCRISIIK